MEKKPTQISISLNYPADDDFFADLQSIATKSNVGLGGAAKTILKTNVESLLGNDEQIAFTNQLNAEVSKLRAKADAHQEEIDSITLSYQKSLSEIKAQVEEEVNLLKNKHNEEINAVKEAATFSLNAVKETATFSLSEMATKLQEMELKCNDKLQEMELKCHDKLQEMELKCHDKLQEMELKCHDKLQEMELKCHDKLQEMELKCNDKLQEMELKCHELNEAKNDKEAIHATIITNKDASIELLESKLEAINSDFANKNDSYNNDLLEKERVLLAAEATITDLKVQLAETIKNVEKERKLRTLEKGLEIKSFQTMLEQLQAKYDISTPEAAIQRALKYVELWHEKQNNYLFLGELSPKKFFTKKTNNNNNV